MGEGHFLSSRWEAEGASGGNPAEGAGDPHKDSVLRHLAFKWLIV